MAILEKVLVSDTLKKMVNKINQIIEVVSKLPDYSQSQLTTSRPTPTGERWDGGKVVFKIPILIQNYNDVEWERCIEKNEDSVTFFIWDYLKARGVLDPSKCLMISDNVYLSVSDSYNEVTKQLSYIGKNFTFAPVEGSTAIYGIIEFCSEESNINVSLVNY
mgnify:CR=1 FL=1